MARIHTYYKYRGFRFNGFESKYILKPGIYLKPVILSLDQAEFSMGIVKYNCYVEFGTRVF